MSSLSEVEKDLVIHYQYRGGDLSPIYKYILSPWAQWCVDTFVPSNVAPNCLTLLGLVISISATLIILAVHPTLEPGTPRWVGFVFGLAIFAYQTLDNMDGKQARKTNSSSALGMVFDHGCDAINAGTTVLAMGAVFGTGWSGKLLITYFGTFVPFYIQTWEEFYTGSMIFPQFNGPTEGLLMAILVCFIQSYYGNEFFHKELFQLPSYLLLPETALSRELGCPSQQNPSVTTFAVIVIMVATCLTSTFVIHPFRVIQHQIKKNEDFIIPLFYLTPFAMILYCGFNYTTLSAIAFKEYPFVTALFFLSMFAEVNIHIMTNHIIHRPLNMFARYPLWILVILTYIVLSGNPSYLYYEATVLFIGTIITCVSLATEMIIISSDYCDALNIHVFVLGKADDTKTVESHDKNE